MSFIVILMLIATVFLSMSCTTKTANLESGRKTPSLKSLKQVGGHCSADSGMDDGPRTIRAKVTFLNVKQGLCVLLQCGQGSSRQDILYDCGTVGSSREQMASDIGAKIAVLASRSVGPMKFRSVIVSHPDADHYNLIAGILDESTVERIYLGGVKKDYQGGSGELKDFRGWVAEQENDNEAEVIYGNTLEDESQLEHIVNMGCYGNDSGFKYYGSIPNGASNDKSLVLRFEMGYFRILLTGDAGEAVENLLVDRVDMHSDSLTDPTVYLMGHHGSKSKINSPRWLGEIENPNYVVISGDNKRYGHPSCESLTRFNMDSGLSEEPRSCFPKSRVNQRVQDAPFNVLSTKDQGDISFTVYDRGCSVATER